MAIPSTEKFAQACVKQGLFVGINPHYLMASAQLRSGISDTPAGDRLGPFRIRQDEWNARSVERDLEVIFDPQDISSWRLQCLFAAVQAFRAQNRLLSRLSRMPSFVELYQEQWQENLSERLVEVRAALAQTAPFIDPAIEAESDDQGSPPAVIADENAGGSTTIAETIVPPPASAEQLFLSKAPSIMQKLIADFDVTDFQAAAILGNIGHECGGFHTFQERLAPGAKGVGGFGWCQWTGSRRRAFMQFCSDAGLDRTSDEANYGFMRQELLGSEKASIKDLKPTRTLPEAVRVFERRYLRAGIKRLESRDRWSTLALGSFKQAVPTNVAKLVDPDGTFTIFSTARQDSIEYWVLNEVSDSSGQVLVKRPVGGTAEVLARDTTVFPIKAGLVPDAVAAALSADLSTDAGPAGPVASDFVGTTAATAARILEQAQACDEVLITRNVPNTDKGNLACAWAVNEVVRRATGKPVGGGLSTKDMGKVLRQSHLLVDRNAVTGGMVVISPTSGSNVGHVGIVGAISPVLEDTPIYSNSSARAIFTHHFTIGKWKKFYRDRKGLEMLFYAVKMQ